MNDEYRWNELNRMYIYRCPDYDQIFESRQSPLPDSELEVLGDFDDLRSGRIESEEAENDERYKEYLELYEKGVNN